MATSAQRPGGADDSWAAVCRRGPATPAYWARRLAVSAAATAALVACATTPGEGPVAPDPAPDTVSVATARRMAALAEDICLPAQTARQTVSQYLAEAGPAQRFGLRPAPPPRTGWVDEDAARIGLAERQAACVVEAEDAFAALPPLLSLLRAPIGTTEIEDRDGPARAQVWRFCRGAAAFSVILADGTAGMPVLAVGVPSRPVRCQVPAPMPPSVKG